jgi:hypothetical protein
MAFVSALPGAIVLVAAWLRRVRPARPPIERPLPPRVAILARRDGAPDA